ncbi:hypothetical protein AQS70_03240 [Pseudomonas endophytica]|uniref:Uncharacterized protein n=1 Tax=Pseudomonas endophytica TaxID=1563157 RepID=A0A0Q0YUG3_9PSED|nr:hypothetical protein [Pseudomonas endophytica]KQB52726.1 hypothetical protein AQS70_03240 [Pseudomonas endophytica]
MNDTQHLLARRVIALLDLTSLTADDSDASIQTLCRKALTLVGPVAAERPDDFHSMMRSSLDALFAP